MEGSFPKKIFGKKRTGGPRDLEGGPPTGNAFGFGVWVLEKKNFWGGKTVGGKIFGEKGRGFGERGGGFIFFLVFF